jgi:6-pyruvoyltetrahydropterin/6-carboxytetrahydropterin synthase
VEGPLDATGQVVDRNALDALVRGQVIERLDHTNLNADVAELAGAVPTTENLASAIQRSLEKRWALPARLKRVRISETDRNIFELETSQ